MGTRVPSRDHSTCPSTPSHRAQSYRKPLSAGQAGCHFSCMRHFLRMSSAIFDSSRGNPRPLMWTCDSENIVTNVHRSGQGSKGIFSFKCFLSQAWRARVSGTDVSRVELNTHIKPSFPGPPRPFNGILLSRNAIFSVGKSCASSAQSGLILHKHLSLRHLLKHWPRSHGE